MPAKKKSMPEEDPVDDGGMLDMLPDDDDVMAAVAEAAVQAVASAPEEAETKEEEDDADKKKDGDYVPPPTTDNSKKPAADNKNRKRVRRVGRMEPRKEIKLLIDQEKQQLEQQQQPPAQEPAATFSKVMSKHEEKWVKNYQALIRYKEQHGDTLVPQCYDQDAKLGRWVHYQRVEYWIYQSTGKAKITPERIARLEAIGFEWDPQRAQWKAMFEKLKAFNAEHGHCKVPKGYSKDTNLANWVRNQRLEYANRDRKDKKTRMTQDRIDILNSIGFTWSTPGPTSGRATTSARTSTTTKKAKAASTKGKKKPPAKGAATTTASSPGSEDVKPAPVEGTSPPAVEIPAQTADI